MTQTAVEWLVDQLMPSIALQTKYIDKFKEKAKQLEKQQIIDAWIATDNELQRMAAEEYYTSTYGSKGSDETKQ